MRHAAWAPEAVLAASQLRTQLAASQISDDVPSGGRSFATVTCCCFDVGGGVRGFQLRTWLVRNQQCCACRSTMGSDPIVDRAGTSPRFLRAFMGPVPKGGEGS